MRTILRPLVLLGLAAAAPAAAQQAVPEYTIEDFLETVSYSGASFSPDETKLLVSHDASGVYNAYAIPLGGGEPVQLTDSEANAIGVISYFPEDERFLYTSDQGGDELNHVYVRSPDGSVVDLTPGERLKAQWMGWAPDRRSFYISTNERDPRFFDLYRYRVAEGYPREVIYRNEDGAFLGPISPDERYLTLTVPRTTNDNDLFLLDRRTGERTNLTPHAAGVNVSSEPQDFSPDGKALYFTTDEGSEFQHLIRYDLATGERETVLAPDWDVMYAYFSPAGKYLVAATNEDARTELRVFDATTMRPVAVPELKDADVTSVRFALDDSKMAMYASGSRFPSDVFVQDLPGGRPRQITRSLNPRIDPAHLVEGQVVRFESYDGLEIPGILYKPHGAGPQDKVPALVWVHGGPGGQSRIGYNPLVQYLVNHGYAVYAINNRGSSGYGKTFYAADDRKHGEADLGDVVASKQMLIETGYVDPERIGIIGGSYGGYMVMAALAFQPDVFDVGVDIFGVTNWLRTLESIPAWWEAQRQALYAELGDPATDAERLRRISPVFHAENVRAPLIVLQGENDPRVLQVESDEIVAAVRKNGVPVEYLVFAGEGHGFRKKENQLKGYRAIREFLDEHLKGEG